MFCAEMTRGRRDRIAETPFGARQDMRILRCICAIDVLQAPERVSILKESYDGFRVTIGNGAAESPCVCDDPE